MKFDPCGWLQRYHFVVINTYFIYVKMQTYPERLYWPNFTAYTAVQHSPNLLWTLDVCTQGGWLKDCVIKYV